MAVKTETISIKVSPEEKKLIQYLAAQQNTTTSKLLYKMVFMDNTGVAAAMRDELKGYTNDDLGEASDAQVQEAYKVLFKGVFTDEQ